MLKFLFLLYVLGIVIFAVRKYVGPKVDPDIKTDLSEVFLWPLWFFRKK